MEISATLYAPNAPGRKPAVLLVDLPAAVAEGLAAHNLVVLDLEPRGVPLAQDAGRPIRRQTEHSRLGDRKKYGGPARGRYLRGVDLLADRPDVDSGHVRAAARDVRGVWLLMAAANDPRIGKIWLDRTPHDGTLFDTPLRIPFDVHEARFYPDAQGFTMLEMPYKGRGLSMVVLVPQAADGLSALEKSLTAANLQTWIGKLQNARPMCSCPGSSWKPTMR